MSLRQYLLEAIFLLRKYYKGFLAAAFFSALAASIALLAKEPVFISKAKVTLPVSTAEASALLPGRTTGENISSSMEEMMGVFFSSYLLPAMLKSRTVSERVLLKPYRYSINGKEIASDLYTYLQTSNRDAALLKLKSRVAAFYLDPQTSITTITIATTSPELSYQIAKAYISVIEDFLYQLKLNTIKSSLEYMDGKLRRANEALAQYEEQLKTLRIKNRDYQSQQDPSFYLEQFRLEREIRIHEEIVKNIRAYYELTMSKLSDRDNKLYVVTEPSFPTNFTYPEINKTLWISSLLGMLVILSMIAMLVTVRNLGSDQIAAWKRLSSIVRGDLESILDRLHMLKAIRKLGAVVDSIFSG